MVVIENKHTIQRPGKTQRCIGIFSHQPVASIALWLIMSLFLILPRFTEAKVYIDINAPSARRLPVAVQKLYSLGGEAAATASTITEIITRDLEMTEAIRVIDKMSYPKEVNKEGLYHEKEEFKQWAAIGTEALVNGRLTMDNRRISVDVRLYDVTTGKQITAANYSRDVRDVRKIAHKIADDVIVSLTGEKGVFNTRIIFISNSTKNKEVYSVDYDGEGVEAITQNGSINLSPAWSPDATAISYVSFKSGTPAVYIKEAATGKEMKLAIREGTFMGAAWAPDGRRLAAVISKEGNADIYIINRDGSGLTRLTDSWGLDVSPSWSPDGKEIAFVSDRGGSPQIYVMDSFGGNLRRLTFEGSYNASPAWSPRGDRIAFAGTNNGNFDIFIINPDGSDIRQLTVNTANNESPSWAPNGRFISFSSARDGSSSIYIMHSDGSGQRRITSMKGNATSPNWGPRPKE